MRHSSRCQSVRISKCSSATNRGGAPSGGRTCLIGSSTCRLAQAVIRSARRAAHSLADQRREPPGDTLPSAISSESCSPSNRSMRSAYISRLGPGALEMRRSSISFCRHRDASSSRSVGSVGIRRLPFLTAGFPGGHGGGNDRSRPGEARNQIKNRRSNREMGHGRAPVF